jgi:hypothetical protein
MDIVEIPSNKEMTRYIKELDEDVKLSEYNLREKSLLCSSIWAKWLNYLFKEKANLEKIGVLKQQILKKKLQENHVQDSILRLKNEDKVSGNDENIKKLNNLLKITQDNIDYIERALAILSNFSYQIKNVTEIMKLSMK